MALIDINAMLPFFFVLAVVYGSLEVGKVFRNKGVNAVIALVIAFFAVSSSEVTQLVTTTMPYAALFFVALFFISFARSATGEKDYSLFAVGLALALIFVSGESPGVDENAMGLAVLAIIGLLLYSTTRTTS